MPCYRCCRSDVFKNYRILKNYGIWSDCSKNYRICSKNTGFCQQLVEAGFLAPAAASCPIHPGPVLKVRDKHAPGSWPKKRIPIFIIPRNFSEKVISCPKRVFLSFRVTFGPQGGPTETWECSHWIRHRIPHNSMCSMVT